MSIDPYAPFDNAVLKLRERCLRYLQSLPAPLAGLLVGENIDIDHLEGRERLFGEFFTFWIGSTLGITDDQTLQTASFASFFLRGYVVLQDWTVDERTKFDPNLVRLSGILLAKSIEYYQSLVPFEPKFWDYFHKYLDEFTIGNVVEQSKHRDEIRVYEEEDIRRLGEKTCIVNVPIAVLALYSKREDVLNRLTTAIENAMIGIQILDDILDWRDDLESGIYTHLLTLAIQEVLSELKGKKETTGRPRVPSRELIEKRVLLSDVVERMLDTCNSHLGRAIVQLSFFEYSPISLHLGFIIQRNKEIKERLIQAKASAVESGGSGVELNNLYNNFLARGLASGLGKDSEKQLMVSCESILDEVHKNFLPARDLLARQ